MSGSTARKSWRSGVARTPLRDAGWWNGRSEIRVGIVLGVGAEWAGANGKTMRATVATGVCDPSQDVNLS